jgi:hypothetical protein
MTTEQGKNKISSPNMLLLAGGVSMALLGCAGLLVAWLVRRRQIQQMQQNIALATQAAAPIDPWIAQREVAEVFGQQPPVPPPASYAMQIPESIPPAMLAAMSPPDALPGESAVEDQPTNAELPLAIPAPVQQTQVISLSESEAMAAVTPEEVSGMISPTPSSSYTTIPMQDAIALPAEAASTTPSEPAADQEPHTMNLSEEVINNLVEQDKQQAAQQNLQDDPFLEAMMRQAQMGIFALPNRESVKSASTDEHEE